MSDLGVDPLASYYTEVGNRVKLLTNTSPLLQGNLNLTMQLAMDGTLTTDQLGSNSAQLVAQAGLDQMRTKLETLNESTQRAIHATLTQSQQQALAQMGYQPPARQEAHHSGFLGGVGTVVSDVTNAVATPLKAVGGEVLHTAQTIGNIPGTAYRAIREMDSHSQWIAAFAALGAVGLVAAAPFTAGTSLAGLGALGGLLEGAGAMTLASAAGGGALAAGTLGAIASSPTDWWDAAKTAWDGERVFTLQAQRQARELLNSNSFVTNAAKDLAWNGGIDEVAQKFAGVRGAESSAAGLQKSIARVASTMVAPTDPKWAQVTNTLSKIASDPGFQQAVATLENGKISFGRDVARGVGLHPGDFWYGKVSGAADALFLTTTDPLIMAGNFRKFSQAARYALPTDLAKEDAAAFIRNAGDTNRSIMRAQETLAHAVNTGDFGIVKRTMADSQSMWDDLIRHRNELGADTYGREELMKFYEQGDGLNKLLSGAGTVKGSSGRTILANTSRTGLIWAQAKDWTKAVIDMADSNAATAQARRLATDGEYGMRVTQEAALPQVRFTGSELPFTPTPVPPTLAERFPNTHAFMGFLDDRMLFSRIERKAGQLFGSFTNMIPPSGTLHFTGPGAAAEIDKFVDLGRVMGVTADTRNAWRSFMMNQENPLLRRAAAQHYLDTMLEVSGAKLMPEGRALADEMLARTLRANGGAENRMLGGVIRDAGELPFADGPVTMPIPHLGELRKAVQAQTLTKYLLDIGDARFVDTAMTKVWKPAVLLRLGFIPRAAGEELLAWMARHGPATYAADFASRAVGEGQIRKAFDAGDLANVALPDNFAARVAHYNSVAHLRPLERMLSQTSWGRPGVKAIEGYTNWLRGVLQDGILPDAIKGAIPNGYRNALLGKEASLRRMLLGGLDPVGQTASAGWAMMFGESTMRNLTAGRHGLLDQGQHHSLLNMLADEPPVQAGIASTPYVEEVGAFGHHGVGDPVYQRAVAENIHHTLGDPAVHEALAPILPRLLPEGMDEGTARGLLGAWNVLPDDSMAKRAAAVGLSGKEVTPDHVGWWLDDLPGVSAEQAKLIRAHAPLHTTDARDLIAVARKYVDDPATLAELKVAEDMLNALDGMDRIHRGWAQMAIPHQGTGTPEAGYFIARDDAQTAIEKLITDGHLHPDVQQYLRGSSHRVVAADGTPVARPLADGATRSYMPVMHPYNANRLDQAILAHPTVAAAAATGDRAATADAVSQMLMETFDRLPNRAVREVTTRDHAQEWFDNFATRYYAGRDDLSTYVADALRGTPDRVVLAAGGELHDPRLAQDITATLQDLIAPGRPVLNNGSGIAFVDQPRSVGTGVLRDEPLIANGKADRVPVNPVWQDVNGQLLHGTTVEESAASHAALVREQVDQVAKENVRRGFVADTSQERLFYRAKGGDLVEVQPGELLVKGRNYVSKTGTGLDRPVKWGDERFFTEGEVPNPDGYLWEAVGPAMRDELDAARGTQMITRDGKRLVHFDDADVGSVTGQLPFKKFTGPTSTTPKQSGGWINKIFDKVITPPIDAIARRPMAYHNFVEAWREISKAHAMGWLYDGQMFADRLPAMFGTYHAGLTSAATGREALAAEARSLSGFLDHDLSKLDDSSVMAYLDGLGKDGLAQIRDRVALAGADTTTVDRLHQLATQHPRAFALAVDGADVNVGAARAMIDEFGSASLNKTWRQAQRDPHVAEWVGRNPEAAAAMDNGGWDLLRSAKDNLAHADRSIGELAMTRTIADTIPFLDSHEFKSQFAEYGRNFMPFWYAEENFIKRWANTIRLAPEAIRKGQLGYMGLKSAGVVRTDDSGKDWVIIPGSGPLIEAMNKVPGLNYVLPVGAVFQTPTASLLPGIGSSLGVPSYSPLVTFPIATLTAYFPQLKPVNEAVNSGHNVDRGIARQFIPTQFFNFYEAAFGNEDNSPRYATALTSAFAMMQANGQGLPENATTDQLDDFYRKLKRHAHTIMIAQAVTNFVSPGQGSLLNTGDQSVWDRITDLQGKDPAKLLRREYLDLIRYQGLDAGTQQYLANNPDTGPEHLVEPMAFTQSTSKSRSGAPLPATAQAVKFYDDNREWMHQWKDAGPWLLPPDQSGDHSGGSIDAYTQQTIDGLRDRMSPIDFMRSMKFKEGAQTYFRARDKYNADVAEANTTRNPTLKHRADLAWTGFSTNYLATHPVFADELQMGDGRVRRQRTLAELQLAVNDPAAPKAWNFEQVKTMVNLFQKYKVRLSALTVSRSNLATQQVDRWKQAFSTVMDRMVLDHPELDSLYTSLIKPEANL